MEQQYTDEQLEQDIQRKRLNAPRVTPQMINDKIVGAHYYVFPNTTLTVCAIELENGFLVVGYSAAASLDNFDSEIGRKLAYQHAYDQIWALEGYLLRQQIHEGV